MRLKTTISILTAALLISAVTGCGKKNDVTFDAETTSEQTTEYTQSSQTTTEKQQTTAVQAQDSAASSSAVRTVLPLEPIAQGAELPTGCEITSLTMVLNYHSLNADKFDLADNWLEKGAVGTTDFRKAFVGDPRDAASFGCYAPVIKNTAQKYLRSKNSQLTASDITGTEFKDLFKYIKNNTPVIVWGTLDCAEGHYSVTWNIDGEDLTWYTPEHCMVLCGYDYELNEVWVGDPMYGDVRSYNMDVFEARYNELQKQAVVIQ